MKKIVVMGMGYIGLPTAAVLANRGFEVLGVDIDKKKIEAIKSGTFEMNEPGLGEALSSAIKSGRLKVSARPEEADAFLICVPTPAVAKGAGKVSDLSYVDNAAMAIAPFLKEGNLVVLESTVPPRTCRKFLIPILEGGGLKAGKDFHLAHCPERVLPGRILHEVVENDRVIGGLTPKCAKAAADLYGSFCEGTIFITDDITAELVKLVENSYRDVNIAFANELSLICREMHLDAREVIELANRHPRVNILNPGPGVGGHCIAVDPWFIVESDERNSKLIKTAREVNDSMPSNVVDEVEVALAASGYHPGNVACLGVAYKNDVEDTRESPALEIMFRLQKRGHNVRAHDPIVKECPFDLMELEAAVKGADLILLLVDHTVFKGLDLEYLTGLMRTPQVIDTRGIWRKQMEKKERYVNNAYVFQGGKS
ncbi:MAG: nucleotide sugar dehydrogenase [Chloroflexi bacterium]|nr:nucleotide sugar dehydrogenase [Chloroflexota bacterium]